MGLGLGIDYSLLIVNRFREELHHGKSVEEATIKTVATAGRTVFFSGITVIITLAALLFFPLMFLKSFGYAGVTVVAMAILGAIIPLPAVLAMLGNKVDKFTVRKSATTPKSDGGWAKTARFVMARPVTVVVAAIALLTIIASPIRQIVFAQVDTRVMPKSSPISIASNEMAADFPGQQGNPIDFVLPNGADASALTAYQQRIIKTAGIVAVTPPISAGAAMHFTAIESMPPRTPEGQKLIQNLRAIPFASKVLIGGVAADYTDSQLGIAHTLPWALGWIALGVLLLLFAFTGSLILPIKAVLLNALSLAAMMGAMTYVFIQGHLMWLVGKFQITGSIDTSMVILVSVVTFGLSMDYEVFLLSRIREEHDAGHNNVESVAIGLQRSARIITAAAILLAIVFAAFITSGVTSIKTLGFGVAIAILLDATIIRALLVPALMRLFGELNWWAPKALRRFSIKH
jgi:RND superfamily putative drug exporter